MSDFFKFGFVSRGRLGSPNSANDRSVRPCSRLVETLDGQDTDSGKFSKVKADPDCQFDPERTRPRYTGQDIATMIAA